jgi:hypothetical protein
MFDAPEWNDYFVMVGGGAAALTGLVFVAMSLHLADIVSNPAHRHRARTLLTALTTVFIRCGLVLMGGQTARAVGVEIFVVVRAEVLVVRSLSQALRGSGGEQYGDQRTRRRPARIGGGAGREAPERPVSNARNASTCRPARQQIRSKRSGQSRRRRGLASPMSRSGSVAPTAASVLG